VTAERWLAAALLVVSGLLLLRLGPGAVQSWRTYRGIGRRRQEDAGSSAPAAPDGVRDRLALLAQEGYQQIGVTRVALPGGVRFAWIAAADDAASYAILAGAFGLNPLTGICSAWPDGMWLGTMHPYGAAADRSQLRVRAVSTTVADAVRPHREALARLEVVHGAPRPIRSMADMLALDADYRARFGGSRLQSLTARVVLPAIGAGMVFVLALTLFVRAPG
jgi:hypothetical protein